MTDRHFLHQPASPMPYQVCEPGTVTSSWHPKVAAFYDYWRALGSPDRIPSRKDMDPLDIPDLLPSVWLYDVYREPIRFRVRLFGTRLTDILKMDPTGRWVDEAHGEAPHLAAALQRLERIVREGIATYSNAQVVLYVGKEHLRIENVTLPLASDGRTVDMLVGFSWITALSGNRV